MAQLQDKNIIETLVNDSPFYVYDAVLLLENNSANIDYFNQTAQKKYFPEFYKRNNPIDSSVFSYNFKNIKSIQNFDLNKDEPNDNIKRLIELNRFLTQYCNENMSHSNIIQHYAQNKELSISSLWKQTGIFEKLMFYFYDKGLDLEYNNAEPLRQIISIFNKKINNKKKDNFDTYDMAMFLDYSSKQLGWDYLSQNYPDLIKTSIKTDSYSAFKFLKKKGFDDTYIDEQGYSIVFYAQSVKMLKHLLENKKIPIQNTKNPEISLVSIFDSIEMDDKKKKKEYYNIINKELVNRQYDTTKINNNNINLLLDSIYDTISKKEFDFLYKKIKLDDINQPLTYQNTQTNLLGHFLNHLSQPSQNQFDPDQIRVSSMMGQVINSRFNIINQLIKEGSDIFTTIPKEQQDVSFLAVYFDVVNESSVQSRRTARKHVDNFEKALFDDQDQQFQDINNRLTIQQLNQDLNYLVTKKPDNRKNILNIEKLFKLYHQYSDIQSYDILNSTTTKIGHYLKNNNNSSLYGFFSELDNTTYMTNLLQSNDDTIKLDLVEAISQKLTQDDFIIPGGVEIIKNITNSIDQNKHLNMDSIQSNIYIQSIQSNIYIQSIQSNILKIQQNISSVKSKENNDLEQIKNRFNNFQLKLESSNQNKLKKKKKPVL